MKTVRLFFPFGRGLAQGYIHNLVEAIKSQGAIETEYNTICPTFVDDVIDPLINIAESDGSSIFNLCGNPMPVATIIKSIENTTGKSPKKISTGAIELTGNNTKARDTLGYKETTFIEALSNMLATLHHA